MDFEQSFYVKDSQKPSDTTTMPGLNRGSADQHQEWNATNPFHQKWNDLDGQALEAAAMLGYTPEEWDTGNVTHLVKEKTWKNLEPPERDAARLLGFDEATWMRIRHK